MPAIEKLTPGRYYYDMWLSRPDLKWAYISINRSASSFIRTYFLNNKFNKIDPRDYKSAHKLVVLRDPLDRLLSGITFFRSGRQFIKNPKRFLTEYEFDPHLKLQKKFLEEVDLDNCTFIQYNNVLKQNLLAFLKQHNTTMAVEPDNWNDRITPISHPDRENEVELGSESSLRFEVFNAMKNDIKLYDTVMNYLDEDFKLYNNVRFYGTN